MFRPNGPEKQRKIPLPPPGWLLSVSQTSGRAARHAKSHIAVFPQHRLVDEVVRRRLGVTMRNTAISPVANCCEPFSRPPNPEAEEREQKLFGHAQSGTIAQTNSLRENIQVGCYLPRIPPPPPAVNVPITIGAIARPSFRPGGRAPRRRFWWFFSQKKKKHLRRDRCDPSQTWSDAGFPVLGRMFADFMTASPAFECCKCKRHSCAFDHGNENGSLRAVPEGNALTHGAVGERIHALASAQGLALGGNRKPRTSRPSRSFAVDPFDEPSRTPFSLVDHASNCHELASKGRLPVLIC